MQLHVKLMGMLRPKTPPGGEIEVPDGATVEAVLQSLDIAAGQVQLVTVNGRPETDRSHTLAAEDDLMVIPPVGGG